MTAFTYTPNLPNPPDNPSNDVSNMQQNANSINGIIAVDHVGFNTTGPAATGGGQHLQVTFNGNNVPTTPTVPPVLFANSVGSFPQLFFYSGTTFNQYLNGANGSTYLLGGIILKWGQVSAISNGATVNFVNAFPNACWSVQVTINIGSTVSPVGTNGFNAAGFTFRTSAGGGVPITYIAIGY
jgi:hypothetical protein